MWILANFEATSLFTLKPATSTSSGGKTLLIPTPFAVKMALLDVVCRTEGRAAGEAAWPSIGALTIAFSPAERVVVNNTFTKILKPRRNPAAPGTAHAGPLQKSIGYREYAFVDGIFGIGLKADDDVLAKRLIAWVSGIQSLGKRGSFMQLQEVPLIVERAPAEYVVLDGISTDLIALDSILQQVDDTSKSLTFEQVNIYTRTPIRLGTDRVLHTVLLPYRVRSSSRGYTYYESVKS